MRVSERVRESCLTLLPLFPDGSLRSLVSAGTGTDTSEVGGGSVFGVGEGWSGGARELNGG